MVLAAATVAVAFMAMRPSGSVSARAAVTTPAPPPRREPATCRAAASPSRAADGTSIQEANRFGPKLRRYRPPGSCTRSRPPESCSGVQPAA